MPQRRRETQASLESAPPSTHPSSYPHASTPG